jgi:hypothetical protein
MILPLPKPDLFIVGAPKSGTTSMYDYLSTHPQVYMCPVKEPLYFCPDVRSGGRRARLEWPQDETRYLDLFKDAHSETRLGEATTRYLVSRQAPLLIRQFQPAARIVVMLREPVETMHALHQERVSNGHEDITDFEVALDADDDRRAGRRLPPDANPLGSVYRETVDYANHLQRWFQALGRERVHVIVFDDLSADTAHEYRRVLEFLDVDPDHQPPSFAPRNASNRQRRWVRRIVDNRLGHWASHDLLTAVVGSNARARLSHRFRHSQLNRNTASRAPLRVDLRKRLEQEMRPEIVRLGELLGRDLVSLWYGPNGAGTA